MKVFLGLGVLGLLVCLSWTEVVVDCSLLMFRVTTKKNLFGDGNPVRAEELTLGEGCPVTRETQDIFELHYTVGECGIESEAFETHVIYKTVLHYVPTLPVFGRGPHDFPLSCEVYREIGPVVPPKLEVPVQIMGRKNAVRMQASITGPTFWSSELHLALGKKEGKNVLKEEIESWNWVSFPILTLSPVVCHFLCHGDIGLPIS